MDSLALRERLFLGESRTIGEFKLSVSDAVVSVCGVVGKFSKAEGGRLLLRGLKVPTDKVSRCPL